MSCRYTYKGKTYEVSEFDDVLRAMSPAEAAAFMPSVQAVPAAPFVTKTEGWLNLALKRVMIMAAEGGYDRVAFVTGEQSAERFSLDKQIDSVSWRPAGADRATITISPKSGAEVIGIVDTKTGVFPRFESGVFGGESLESVLGKEMAERVLASPEGSLAGDGLMVEAKGMRAFYDTIVPAALKKLLPKVGGGQMATVSIGSNRLEVLDDPSGRGFIIYDRQTGTYYRGGASGSPWSDDPYRAKVYLSESSANKAIPDIEGGSVGLEQPGFDVTPAMREKVSEGLPLFSRDRASWTNDRIDRLLSAHAYTMDDGRSKAYAGFVSPEDFLRATTPADSVESLEAEKRPLDEKELAGEVQPIFLKGEPQDDGTWKTTGHEGRHRMMALRDAGVRRVPVVFDVGYGLTREPLQGLYVTPQRWSGAGQAQGGFFVDNLIPISYKHAGDLRDAFGGQGAVRFSRNRAQTDTPEFRRWFGDSKVVDENGEPLVVYHGTTADHDFVKFWTYPDWSLGAHFGTPEQANSFADQEQAVDSVEEPGARVMPVYLSIRNPLRLIDPGSGAWNKDAVGQQLVAAGILDAEVFENSERMDSDEYGRAMRAAIEAAGYDGVVYLNRREGGFDSDEAAEFDSISDQAFKKKFPGASDSYIAFEPTQIKSAIGNRGTFSPRSEDIRKSEKRTQTDTPEFKAWFGNSQIRDESGDPLVVYHATPANFTEFKPGGNDPTLSGPAMWFTGSKEYQPAAHNIGRGKGVFEGGTNVMPVYLKMERPLVIDDKGMLDWAREVFAGGSIEFPHLLPKKWVDEVRRDSEYDGIIFDGPALGWKNAVREYIVFEPTQIKSAIGNSGAFDPANPDITKSEDREDRATSAWQSPSASKFDDWVYKLQDKQVDTKRVVDEIKDAAGALADDLDVYLQEELFHGRAAKRTEDFVNKELRPLVDAMAKDGLKIEDLDTFLHARHAREANDVIAQRNPEMQDGGSGMFNQEAEDYFADLDDAKRRKLEAAAAKVDAILAETRKMMVDYQLESPDVINGWGRLFKHYVPLYREDEGAGVGIGQGFSIKGREVKSRTGSTRKVVDIFANIAMQRERTIVRGEKNRVSQALHGLATANPNKEFWTVDKVPTTPTFNPATGLVEDRPDNLFKMRDNVIVSKVLEQDGEGRTVVREKAVIFNEKNERAVRMATALKSLDAAQLEGLMGASAAVTRYFASINTQYNPVFGIINLMRDVQGAIVNLNTTELKDDKLKVARGTMSALMGIMSDARKARRGEAGTSEWSALWEDFQSVGGQTGYRQLFQTSADRAKDIQRALDPDAWMDSKWGRIFTANGTLKVPLSVAMKGARWLFDLLSDYNLAMENGIRLSAYKVALDKGMSRERAASLAKNLTVNFNRKGQVGQQAGALYAFFNAAMQGTARLGQTLFEMEPGKPKTIRLSGLGKKIVYGGMLLGTAQAVALSMMGFSDDDPPDFVRERSLIIPTGGKTYISIPMPLGLHVIPNVGRVTTEWALSGFKNTPQRVASLLGTFADSFNPIGNAGWSMQTLAPTALDPLVALTENKDWQGRPIAKESMNRDMPGPLLHRDTATSWSKLISESINYLSGGDKYSRGVLSPTPDQIDYLVGQLTGGVGREISKVEQTVMGLVRGEEVPTYKVPLVGRLIGDSGSQASEGTAFYANAQKLNKLETEIKLLREDGKTAEAQALRASRPEAYLMTQANYAERAIQRLRKEKSELIKEGAPREKIREIEERITARMAGLNRAMEALEAAR